MRLLLIEDDPLLLKTLAANLREEGFAIDTAADGAEGLAKAREGVHDAIVLDVMLPKLDGWGVLTSLRPHQRTPVLMLTARDALPDRLRGLDGGADDYLTKPFEPDELVARLRALIRRSHGDPSPRLSAEGVELNQAARTVALDGAPVTVTAREYSLLEYLLLRRGRVVTRTELYEHLFDEDDDTLSNLLDVHVSNLRRKLGREVIRTRRGQGYIIE